MLSWLMIAAQSVAPAQYVDDDIRCIVFVEQAMEAAPANQRAVLSGGLLYFIGRVEGAAPGIDIPSAVAKARQSPEDGAAADGRAVACSARLLRQTEILAAFDPAVTRIEPTR